MIKIHIFPIYCLLNIHGWQKSLQFNFSPPLCAPNEGKMLRRKFLRAERVVNLLKSREIGTEMP